MDDQTRKIMALREKLAGGGVTLGSWMQLDNPSVAEIMGHAGYDWVAVDLEHGHFSLSGLPDLFRALELGGTLPFARIARGRPKEIKQALDAGARGLIIPTVESAQDLDVCIRTAFYPPAGTRGVGYCRANLFGKRFDDYAASHQNGIFMAAQIETRKGVDHLAEILNVPGLDAVMVGPYDLSGSMGMTARFDHPVFKKTLAQILACCKAAGIACGFHVVQPEPGNLSGKIGQGYQFIAYGIDAVFLYTHSRAPERG
jgi:2-dehydro-3-deoxyglucarate aldolase